MLLEESLDAQELDDLNRALALSLQDIEPPIEREPVYAAAEPRTFIWDGASRTLAESSDVGGSKRRLVDIPDDSEHRGKKPRLERELRIKELTETENHQRMREEIRRKALNPVQLPMKYKGGALRLTRTPGRNRVNTVSLEDLIHPTELTSAFVFAYCIENDFLFKYFPFKTCQNYRSHCLVYVGRDLAMDPQGKECAARIFGAMQVQYSGLSSVHVSERTLDGENFKAIYPYVPGGCIHSKMMVLIYPDFLRLIITSANLIQSDVLFADNMWYIEDFPRLSSEAAEKYEETKFEATLIDHLEALGCPETFLEMYLNVAAFDFSAVKVHLVTSKRGSSSKEDAAENGQLALRRIVRDKILQDYTDDTLPQMEFEVCVGSVGKLEVEGVVKSLLESCAGNRQKSIEGLPALKMIFPTLDDGAGNIGSHIVWKSLARNSAEYLKRIFYHYKSKDEGSLFHTKCILALRAGQPAALPLYIYLGSHNFSSGAWGKVVPEKCPAAAKKYGPVRLENVANFECGVVVKGEDIVGMLETTDWEDVVPYVRPSEANRYKEEERPFTMLPNNFSGPLVAGSGTGPNLLSLESAMDLVHILSAGDLFAPT
ncbi:tyrosyl-DNA phosphodiesterase-domain-containing protein [Mycena maculata]|uniref:Tyrosyl-DNA phosphodiesterase-domain-containing protein n=1 Tax=Mycena maculata TaxID=230809 RepID=A0AAD7IZX2_9AGAR|nr:tyrosyl-DNA phosphodiesterase-domain-containing protein [Mycena maculata]